MKKAVAALALAGAAIFGLAACNSAPPTPPNNPVARHSAPVNTQSENDQVFVKTVRGQVSELNGLSDKDLVDIGHGVCTDFDNGTTFQDEVTSMDGYVSPYNAGYLIGASIGVYCPQHKDLVEQG